MSDPSKESMFGNAIPVIFNNARELRSRLTKAEQLLWDVLKDKKLEGMKFRQQHPFDTFILDFYCHKVKLCIEFDGGIHNEPEQKQYDLEREKLLLGANILVIRFSNEEILNNLPFVISEIKKVVILRRDQLEI